MSDLREQILDILNDSKFWYVGDHEYPKVLDDGKVADAILGVLPAAPVRTVGSVDLPDRPPIPAFPITEESWWRMWADIHSWVERIAFAATTAQPHVINTVEELEALPDGTWLITRQGQTVQASALKGLDDPAFRVVSLPATVLPPATTPNVGSANGWSPAQWEEWSNELAALMDQDVWDGDEDQETIIMRFVKHYASRPYEEAAPDRTVGSVDWDALEKGIHDSFTQSTNKGSDIPVEVAYDIVSEAIDHTKNLTPATTRDVGGDVLGDIRALCENRIRQHEPIQEGNESGYLNWKQGRADFAQDILDEMDRTASAKGDGK